LPYIILREGDGGVGRAGKRGRFMRCGAELPIGGEGVLIELVRAPPE
jgi:hypothetical protein